MTNILLIVVVNNSHCSAFDSVNKSGFMKIETVGGLPENDWKKLRQKHWLLFKTYESSLQEAADAANLPDDTPSGWARRLIFTDTNSFQKNLVLKDALVVRSKMIDSIGYSAVIDFEKKLARRMRPCPQPVAIGDCGW